eukprot:Hpha_TRINITY_DN15803_c3_g3::TRINITY_DN15803_c3_g3_i2::g.189860::m.189860
MGETCLKARPHTPPIYYSMSTACTKCLYSSLLSVGLARELFLLYFLTGIVLSDPSEDSVSVSLSLDDSELRDERDVVVVRDDVYRDEDCAELAVVADTDPLLRSTNFQVNVRLPPSGLTYTLPSSTEVTLPSRHRS